MNQLAGPSESEFDRLKKLLLSAEAQRLAELEGRLDRLDDSLGTPERMEKATADVLVGAFRAAEVARHRDLANAVAPLVVAAIRNEIRNSRDMMVEALYPITGRLVSAAVANAFRDLVADLNDKIERALSTRHWSLRLRALVTGRSMSEIALAEAQTPQLRSLLLLERGSGILLAAWTADGVDAEKSELVSGLIAAVTGIAESVFGAEDGELRTLDLGAARVLLRAAPLYLIAAECVGPLRPEHEREFDDAVLSLVGKLDRGEAELQPSLAALARVLFREAAGDARAKWSKWPLVLGALAGLCALALYPTVQRALVEWRMNAAFREARASAPQVAVYPLSLRFDHKAQNATIIGLAPATDDVARIRDKVAQAAGAYQVTTNAAILANAAQAQAALAAGENANQRLERETNELRARLAQAQAELAAARNGLAEADRKSAALEAAQRELAQALPSARDRLEKMLARTAIFFLRDEQLADPERAGARLNEISRQLRETGLHIRVVGHADPVGGRERNLQLARARAQTIVDRLVAEGVAATKLTPVARADAQPISDGVGRDLRDRRVTFEPAFDDEAPQ
jgi:outer membrane protein OmpA-like peptidoglycan-associated protein